jgi:hypothetical protein
MESQVQFRSRCEQLFVETLAEFPEITRWRFVPRSAAQGGPTFEVSDGEGAVHQFVVADICVDEPDDFLRDQFRAFLRSVLDQESA